MKTIFPFSLILVISYFGVVGCQSKPKPLIHEPEKTLLRLGMRYPPLLSPEKAHTVTLNLRAVPSYINNDDIKEIVCLTGRVPGLIYNEILLIRDSLLHPGMIEVYLRLYYVVMEKKDMHWRVYRIQPAP